MTAVAGLRALLGRLPQPIVAALRLSRTIALRLTEPFDWMRRRVMFGPNRRPAPPMWLRRHSGPVWGSERAAAEIASVATGMGLLRENDAVLDVGCGWGSMALELRGLLGRQGRYVGFDVHPPSIRWCRTHLATDPRLRFELAVLQTAWSHGDSPAGYRFPMDDAGADFVLAKSVFTHLLEPDARHYLQEIRRVLRPGRAALVTAFLLGESVMPQFPYGGPDVWWRVRVRPEAAVAYTRSRFLDMVEDAELGTENVIDGYWTGRSGAPHFQDILVLR